MPTQIEAAKMRTIALLERDGLVLSPEEKATVEAVDFGLGDLARTGIQLFTYINNDRYCARELVFFPRQTCPQHLHPSFQTDPGKTETIRVKTGKLWAYVAGPKTGSIHATLPVGSEAHYTVFHEIELNPGQQCTIVHGVLHWFQAGDEGATALEISSTARDARDIFTDPRIKRSG